MATLNFHFHTFVHQIRSQSSTFVTCKKAGNALSSEDHLYFVATGGRYLTRLDVVTAVSNKSQIGAFCYSFSDLFSSYLNVDVQDKMFSIP